MHKNHTHTVKNEATPSSYPTAAKPLRNGMTEPSRTTSAFTTHSGDGSTTAAISTEPAVDGAGGGWGLEGPSQSEFPQQSGMSSGGFGSSGDHHGASGNTRRSLGGGRVYNKSIEETVTVTLLPEKEGMFMFQHHNYEVKCVRKASAVIRRYSDFVWLLDCLHKRYPFRQLPLLPPKRVAGELMLDATFHRDTDEWITVNGRHLSADVTFMEKRRRGLVRFSNTLVRHPILSQEQLVVMFLTVPTVSGPASPLPVR